MTTTETPKTPATPETTVGPPRPRRRIRARWIVAAVVCVGAVVWMVTSLSTNLDYWKPVVQAVQDRQGDGGKHLRVGGLVVPGSRQGRTFQLSDGEASMVVQLGAANAPETVQDCTPLVVGGRWQGQTLVADELTRRHGSQYSSKAHPLANDTPVSSCMTKGSSTP